MSDKPAVEYLEVIDGEKMHERIYAYLRHAVMTGTYLPGEQLTLRVLAASLGTSIIPVRDAILRLMAEKALVRTGRSIRIPVMTFEDFCDVVRFREALEGEAAMLAAARATADDLERIRAANAHVLTTQHNDTLDAFLKANQRFHFAIYAAAHNPLLQSMIETLWLQVGPYLGALVRREEHGSLRAIDLSAHDRLIAAIDRRDAAGARAALIADLEDSTDIYSPWQDINSKSRAGQAKPAAGPAISTASVSGALV